MQLLLKDTLRAFDDFKNKQKSAWSVFWYVKSMYILKVCTLYNTLYIKHKTQMLRKLSSDKINGKKMSSSFFRELQVITVFLLTCDSYMSWSTRFVALNLCVAFFIFDSVSFLLKLLFNKMHGLFDFEASKLK